MLQRFVRSRAAVGLALASASATLSTASSEQRVYASGEALGRGVRLELWKAKHENVVVLDLESELIQLGMTKIRDHANNGPRFVHDANAVLRATVDLALTELPNDEEAVVTTPRGHKAEGVLFEDDVKVCGISVATKVDVHKGLQTVLHGALPFEAQLGDVIVGTTAKGDTKIIKSTLPEDLDGHDVMLLCPEFAAIEQVSKIIHMLKQEGVEEEKITVVTLVTCPEAADKFCQTFGDARLVTASFDASRDKDGCIVPGIGAFEDRYLGAVSDLVIEEDDEEEDGGKEEAGELKAKLNSWFSFGSK